MSYLTDDLLKLLKSYEEDKIERKEEHAWERPYEQGEK